MASDQMTPELFCLAAFRDNPHDLLCQNRERVKWASVILEDLPEVGSSAQLIPFILEYNDKFGHCPDSPETLKTYLDLNTNGDQKKNRSMEVYSQTLDSLSMSSEEVPTDFALILDGLMDDSVRLAHTLAHKVCVQIVTGGYVPPSLEKVAATLTPIDLSVRYFRESIARIPRSGSKEPAGLLHENADFIYNSLLDVGDEEDQKRRVKTLLPHLDDHPLVLTKGMFVGLLAYAGVGKTTLDNTLVHNFAMQGFNVLYVSLEHQPKKIWQSLGYMHSKEFRHDFHLPRWSDWLKGPNFRNAEDVAHLRTVIADMKDRGPSFPGLIDVQQFWTWPEIKDYIETNDGKNHYDVLVVDYLTHLATPGARNHVDAIEEIISDFNSLCHTFRDGEGLLGITPIQANREGNKAASDPDNPGGYELHHIRQFSSFERDMDVVLSVYTDDDMRSRNTSSIRSLKIRERQNSSSCNDVPSFFVNFDPTSLCYSEDQPFGKETGMDLIKDDLLDSDL